MNKIARIMLLILVNCKDKLLDMREKVVPGKANNRDGN